LFAFVFQSDSQREARQLQAVKAIILRALPESADTSKMMKPQ
jgi:hypothetical protein